MDSFYKCEDWGECLLDLFVDYFVLSLQTQSLQSLYSSRSGNFLYLIKASSYASFLLNF